MSASLEILLVEDNEGDVEIVERALEDSTLPCRLTVAYNGLEALACLRREQNEADVFDYIEKHKNSLILPDQDVISALYGQRIIALDSYIYNMTERLFAVPMPGDRRLTLDWIRRSTAVIHYCGRNKPWKKRYLGRLNCFYQEAERKMYEQFGCHGPQIEE